MNVDMEQVIFSRDRIKDEWFDSYSWITISYSKGLSPLNYLEFANEDLKDGGVQRNLINSISNAKRALHLEVETLCKAFGQEHAKKKAKTFPQRLKFLNDCGMVRYRLLTKLNNIRNLVEHEYYIPERNEVEDFIDVVDLFIDAMRLNRSRYPCDIGMLDAVDDSGKFHATSISMNFEKGIISLKILPLGVWRGDAIYKEISVNDEDYVVWVSFILRNNR